MKKMFVMAAAFFLAPYAACLAADKGQSQPVESQYCAASGMLFSISDKSDDIDKVVAACRIGDIITVTRYTVADLCDYSKQIVPRGQDGFTCVMVPRRAIRR